MGKVCLLLDGGVRLQLALRVGRQIFQQGEDAEQLAFIAALLRQAVQRHIMALQLAQKAAAFLEEGSVLEQRAEDGKIIAMRQQRVPEAEQLAGTSRRLCQ